MTNEHPDTEDVEQIDTGQAPQLAENAAPEQASPEPADAALRNMYPSMYADDALSLEEPTDEDMQAVRDDWVRYPAEINKAIGHQAFDALVGKTVEIDGQQVEVTREMATRAVARTRAIAGDLGLSQAEMKEFKARWEQVEALPDVPLAQARTAALGRLSQEHGEKAEQAFQCARAYVAKNPVLARVLDKSRLGNDPAIIAMIARRAMALHEAGKLRLK